jgi:hypothetical protein
MTIRIALRLFSILIQELKKGPLQFQLEDDSEDLFSYVCKEYVAQLNAELTAVSKEIEFYNLMEEPRFSARSFEKQKD